MHCPRIVTTTEGVRIEATSQYVDKFSRPKDNLHRFTYRITITNESKYYFFYTLTQ
jgi:uncharacterized protein affecting Mg2+/Co2+ transport